MKIIKLDKLKTGRKSTAYNEGFGVRRGVASWDTSQEFGSSPPVRAFAIPRPTPSPRHVVGNVGGQLGENGDNFKVHGGQLNIN